MNKIKIIWRVLTKKDWYLISSTTKLERPHHLWIGNIEVIYHKEQ